MRTAILLPLYFLIATATGAEFALARFHYPGGGDWYANPSSLPNLIRVIGKRTTIDIAPEEKIVSLEDPDLFNHPVLYMTGHGNVFFAPDEARVLRRYLTGGGFLFADDNYGMDKSFRREVEKLFPDRPLAELPFSHSIFRCFYSFPQGIPKIHKHDGGPGKSYGVFVNGRMVIFYSHNTDLGDGWEDTRVHNDPEEKREQALRMGINVIVYALTH